MTPDPIRPLPDPTDTAPLTLVGVQSRRSTHPPTDAPIIATVPTEMTLILQERTWQASPTTPVGYTAVSRQGPTKVTLHDHVFMHYYGPIPAGYRLKPRDFNYLNCMPQNLLCLTKDEAAAHTRTRRDSTTGYRGISYSKDSGYRGAMSYRKQQVFLPFLPTPHQAAHGINHLYKILYPMLPPPNVIPPEHLPAQQVRREIEAICDSILMRKRLP